MNIAITGASGNLGSVLCKRFDQPRFSVFPVPSELYRPDVDAKAIADFLRVKRVAVLIHCASLTNVDQAEADPNAAHVSNIVLTEVLAKIASGLAVKLVYISSTGVYGGNSFPQDGLNSEDAHAVPLNHYHSTKLRAEAVVGSTCARPLILRVGWLFGSASPSGKDFVLARIQEMAKLSSTDEYFSNSEQFGNPTSSEFVAQAIGELLQRDVSGTLNCVNDGAVSRYDFVRAIKEVCGFEFILIPKPDSFFSRKAKVPSNETGDTARLFLHCKTSHWWPYLVQYCDKLKDNSWRLA
jgi:dTDP-4-dehydrorhamnose reductase